MSYKEQGGEDVTLTRNEEGLMRDKHKRPLGTGEAARKFFSYLFRPSPDPLSLLGVPKPTFPCLSTQIEPLVHLTQHANMSNLHFPVVYKPFDTHRGRIQAPDVEAFPNLQSVARESLWTHPTLSSFLFSAIQRTPIQHHSETQRLDIFVSR
jgi:hypothetical protein